MVDVVFCGVFVDWSLWICFFGCFKFIVYENEVCILDKGLVCGLFYMMGDCSD